jgi:MFS family permease
MQRGRRNKRRYSYSVVCSAYAYLPVFWAIPREILSQPAAATAVGMINAVGSVAGFAGPFLFGYLHTRTNSFSPGLSLMTLSALAGGLLILCVPGARHQRHDRRFRRRAATRKPEVRQDRRCFSGSPRHRETS